MIDGAVTLFLRLIGVVQRNPRAFASAIGALAVGAVVVFVYHRVDAYFDGVRETRSDLASVRREAAELKSKLTTVGKTLEQNRKAFEQERDQLRAARELAEKERDAAQARADFYRSIRDEALSAPVEDRGPVSPVVRDTVERLWGPGNPAS